MPSLLPIAVALVLVGGSIPLFASEDGVAFSPEVARALYREQFANSTPGVYEAGNVLLLVLDVRYDNEAEPEDIDSAKLDAQLEAVESYIDRPPARKAPSPFAEKMTALLDDADMTSFSVPAAAACDIECTALDGGCRYVVAMDAVPLRAARDEARNVAANAGAPRGVADWGKDLRTFVRSLKTEDERRTVRFLLGFPFLDMAVAPGVRIEGSSVDFVALSRSVAAFGSNPSALTADQALAALPTLSDALLFKAEKNLSENRFDLALVLAEEASLGTDAADFFAQAVQRADSLFGTTAWTEYKRLRDSFTASESFFANRDNPIWQRLAVSGGNLAFAPKGGAGSDEFETARKLFAQGRDIPKILDNLVYSIEQDPSDPIRWSYLAKTLQIDKKPIDAILCFKQALKNGADPAQAWPRLLELLNGAGYPALASGVAWHMIASSDGEMPEKAVRTLQATFPEILK